MAELLWHEFAVSGVQTWLWLPPLAAFGLSFFSAMVGISGAFLLLPFQMSVLGFAGPAASATNLLFNLYATPGGVWRYSQKGQLFWPLAGLITLGTLPGIVLGFYLRVLYLPDAAYFKPFVGVVLLYLSWQLLRELVPLPTRAARVPDIHSARVVARARVKLTFQGQLLDLSPSAVLGLAFVVGVIGGTYGIGGGAIIAPFCIAVFRLPVTAVAGAALASTFATSAIGVLTYSILPLPAGGHAAPDWALGTLFGAGGFAGTYLGAACQHHVPQRVLKGGLGLVLAVVGLSYWV